jgi:hypothetical protein
MRLTSGIHGLLWWVWKKKLGFKAAAVWVDIMMPFVVAS